MASRTIALFSIAGALALAAIAAQAQPPPWNRPGTAVTLEGGRIINLYCQGEGAPAVLLNSGLGHGADVWFRVQPALARITRTCSFDRAGYRFSQAGPMPRNPRANAHDIKAMLEAAHIEGPYVLVGHSLGGAQVRRFADLYPRDVAGLVLVDPGTDTQAAGLIGAGAFATSEGDQDDETLTCIRAAAEGRMKAGDPQFAPCGSPPPGSFAASPAMAQAVLSELAGEGDLAGARDAGSLGALPLILLSAGNQFEGRPDRQQLYREGQARMAAQSSVGIVEVVDSGHVIHFEKPEAVISAVTRVVEQVRAR